LDDLQLIGSFKIRDLALLVPPFFFCKSAFFCKPHTFFIELTSTGHFHQAYWVPIISPLMPRDPFAAWAQPFPHGIFVAPEESADVA
jgi:hypothetical protein